MHKPLYKKLRRDLWNKRWLVTALVIILAVAISSYAGLKSVYLDLYQAQNAYYQQQSLADFSINLKRAPQTSAALIQSLPNVKKIHTRIAENIMMQSKKTPIPGIALSLPENQQQSINKILIQTGTWFTSPDAAEAILVQQFAKAHHLRPGDWIRVRLPGKMVRILIVGTAYSPEYVFIKSPGVTLAPDPFGYAVMFMPRRFLQEHANLNGSYNQVIGLVNNKSPTTIKNTMNLIAKKLDRYGVAAKTAETDNISVKMLSEELGNIEMSTTIFPTIFLLVAGLVVNVLMTRLVAQQRVIIGTFKAIGLSRLTLVLHYLSFGAVIGLLGGIVGGLLGFWLQSALLKFYVTYFQMPNIQFHVHYSVWFVGVTISVVTALLGSISGAVRAMRLAPAEAMRPASPNVGGHIFIERVHFVWSHLSFNAKLIMRSIFRNPFRSFVTILSACVATALVYSSISLNDSIFKVIDYQFTQMQHQNITISLRDPKGHQIMPIMRTLPGVRDIEAQLNVSAQLSSGPYLKDISITGIPVDNRLLTPLDQYGRVLHINQPGLVLTQTLANILHVRMGDTIVLKPLIGLRKVVKAKVIGIIHSYLGLSAYANLRWLSKLIGDSWAANTILFNINPTKLPAFSRAVSQYEPLINIESKKHSKALILNSLNSFMTMFIVIMILFSGAIAISCILNNSMVSLSERERDVATFSVLGMTRKEIFTLFFNEGVLLNGIGLLLGLAGGVLLAQFMTLAYSTELYRFPLVIYPSRFYESAGLIVGFFAFSYFVIYRLIYKIKWLAVLNTRE